MGFRKNWDVGNIANDIRTISREASSTLNDGFISWGCKQDLYLLKDLIDNALLEAPSFGDLEEEWLKEREQQRIIKILKQG